MRWLVFLLWCGLAFAQGYQLIEDAGHRKALAAAAKQKVVEHYSWQHAKALWVEFFKSLM